MKLCLLLLAGILAAGGAYAQKSKEDEKARRDQQKTKQAQAVSKEVYDKIQQAQEKVDEEDYKGALRVLNNLNRSDKLTEYEKSNVLNYIGFVHYNIGDMKAAIATYEEMLRIPSLEEQIRKQTVYTLAQLCTMEELYTKAIRLLEEWFVLELKRQAATQLFLNLERDSGFDARDFDRLAIHDPRLVLELQYCPCRRAIKKAAGREHDNGILHGTRCRDRKRHVDITFDATGQGASRINRCDTNDRQIIAFGDVHSAGATNI